MRLIRTLCVLAALAMAGLLPAAAHAAQSYDNCNNFIDSLPTTISTQGVWCLRHDLATNITSGFAIDIEANNVTIDCNDFKLGGLAAGNSSTTAGIYANSVQNVTVRHCGIRGFLQGIFLNGGGGHLLEDNRLDNNLSMGIYLDGDNSIVRGNRVFDTGGALDVVSSYGIFARGAILDNTVFGVSGDFADTAANSSAFGIGVMFAGPALVDGNRVSGLASKGAGIIKGIFVDTDSSSITNNTIVLSALATGTGIHGYGANTACMHNVVVNFTKPYDSCDAGINNVNWP
jgi:parallel beta-helix repeat protein